MKSAPNIIVQMIHIQGGLKGKIQEFTDPVITIGRLPSSAITFPPDEPGVSREHARIQREGNKFRLVALKDRFGTFVNGKQVREAVLRAGDVIEFGSGGPKVSFSTEISPEEVAPTRAVPPEPVAGPPHVQLPRQWPAEISPGVEGIAAAAPAQASPRATPSPPDSSTGAGQVADQWQDESGLSTQKTTAPLIIQYGPTIRSYRELPVVIGKHQRCDFVLQHPGILDQHVQILFNHGSYYVNDLTGRHMISVNGKPIDRAAKLNPFDEIACTPNGPVFRFLGEGRLAEIEPPPPEEALPQRTQETDHQQKIDTPAKTPLSGFLSRFARGDK